MDHEHGVEAVEGPLWDALRWVDERKSAVLGVDELPHPSEARMAEGDDATREEWMRRMTLDINCDPDEADEVARYIANVSMAAAANGVPLVSLFAGMALDAMLMGAALERKAAEG